MHHDLEQYVPEFLSEMGVIGIIDGLDDFVAFFDERSAQGGMALLAIPRATIRRTQAGHDFLQAGNGGYIFHKELLVFPNSLTSSLEDLSTKIKIPEMTKIVPA